MSDKDASGGGRRSEERPGIIIVALLGSASLTLWALLDDPDPRARWVYAAGIVVLVGLAAYYGITRRRGQRPDR